MNMSGINKQIDILGRQFSKLQQKMETQKLNNEKTANDVIVSTKEEIKYLSEYLTEASRRTPHSSSSGNLKAQSVFNAKKRKLKSQILEKKAATTKYYMRKEVDATAEYAAFTMDFALLAIDEAILAFYEAVEKSENYMHKYGDENK